MTNISKLLSGRAVQNPPMILVETGQFKEHLKRIQTLIGRT